MRDYQGSTQKVLNHQLEDFIKKMESEEMMDVDEGFKETHEILIRCARRCAYDLSHVVQLIDPNFNSIAERMIERSKHWVDLFKSGNSMKDYRIHLYTLIENKDKEIKRLRKLIKDNNIQDFESEEMPF